MKLPYEVIRPFDLLVGWQRYFLAATSSPDHIIALRFIRNALLEIRRQVEVHKLVEPLNRQTRHDELLWTLERHMKSFKAFENSSSNELPKHHAVPDIVNSDQLRSNLELLWLQG